MIEDFLSSIETKGEYSPYQLGSDIQSYTESFPDIEDKELVILGVSEGRDAGENNGTKASAAAVRKALYKLSSSPHLKGRIADIGDILAGETLNDTYRALEVVLGELLEDDKVVIVIGGSLNLSYPIYSSLEKLGNSIDISLVAPRIPVEEDQLLMKICNHYPHYLFNVNALAYQSHYIPYQSRDLMNKLQFNQIRLGQLKEKLDESEPLIRNTHALFIDIGAIKQSDAPAIYSANPNGLEGEQACKLSYYGGVSDLTRVFGLFEMNPEFDYRDQTAKLCAQMCWYFMDGYSSRMNDHPQLHSEFLRYRCSFDEKTPDLIFHKSKRSARWWMEVPNPKSIHNSDKNVIVPCSYADYQAAAKGELPDRYLSAIQKMH